MAIGNPRERDVNRHLFCFGLGYSAGVLAARLRQKGWAVSGTTTSLEGAERLSRHGYGAYVFGGTHHVPQIGAALQEATHVLLSIPPGANGDPALGHFAQDLASSPRLTWIGYLSTVGVYGDAHGGFVDEDTPARPASERGQRRLAAENAWRQLGRENGKCVMVFRLPGIYGPGRSAIDDIEAGTARRIVKPGQVFNRIHVADIATALEAAIANPHAGRVYNVTDDDPGPPQDVVAYAAKLLGQEPPPELDFEAAQLSDMARSFYSESKRVKNTRMKKELGVVLGFPSYREGLEELIRHKA
jgi:dTDP-4-dehydrorhamnose reductase